MEEDSITISLREEVAELQAELTGVKKELRLGRPLGKQLTEAKSDRGKAEGKVEACEARLEDAHKA